MINTILIPERLDSVRAIEFDKEVESLANIGNYLIFDFSECNYLASMGIRIIVKTKKTLLQKNGELFLVGVKPLILGILELSGINSVVQIKNCVSDVESAIEDIGKTCGNQCYITSWKELTLAGYDELQFAVGTGAPADDINAELKEPFNFISTGYCAGFIKNGKPELNDFRVTEHPDKAGIYLIGASSFGSIPTAIVKIDKEHLSLREIVTELEADRISQVGDSISERLYVISQTSTKAPSITILMIKGGTDSPACGCTFTLEEWKKADAANIFSKTINHNLTLDNIVRMDNLDESITVSSPECAMFCPAKCRDSRDFRPAIKSYENFDLYKEFLARRIYTDSAKIEIRKIHGGFSAQTYQVTSYDEHGRKLRPTVMKVADKAMIERESSNCTKNALPYIMNNSAQVIGTEFFADMGALRYNFVGIGGDGTQIKWLTDYYINQPYNVLKPVFDKIFTKILNPWYGQVVEKDIKPYLEHNPTITFFPHIYETAKKELDIDFQDQYIYIEELGKEIINPYWFLKYEYPSRREFTLKYYSCICHGDLNMQNILLDETNNVYLIDFSETKMRCAISDFARLEAIMLIDNAPCKNKEEYHDYSDFIALFYENFNSLDSAKAFIGKYSGLNNEWVGKNVQLVNLLRGYAINCVHGDNNPVPFYFSFLEWCLPIVCYTALPQYTKRLSMIVSAILINKIKGLE